MLSSFTLPVSVSQFTGGGDPLSRVGDSPQRQGQDSNPGPMYTLWPPRLRRWGLRVSSPLGSRASFRDTAPSQQARDPPGRKGQPLSGPAVLAALLGFPATSLTPGSARGLQIIFPSIASCFFSQQL